MLGHQFAYSARIVCKVKEVHFGILCGGNSHSVTKVDHLEVMDDTTPKPKLVPNLWRAVSECPGHFGHIELARPVFHPGFILKVKKILESICVNCGKLKADIVSHGFFPCLLCTPPSNVLGALSKYHGECQTRTASVLDNRDVLLPGVADARFRSLDRCISLHMSGVSWTRSCTVKRGLSEECEKCTHTQWHADPGRSVALDGWVALAVTQFERLAPGKHLGGGRSVFPNSYADVLLFLRISRLASRPVHELCTATTRMAMVWGHCKGKLICDTDEPKEEGEGAENDEPKKGHGGCGHPQPQIRKEGLKLFLQYKRSKDDDDICEIKSLQPDRRLFMASEVYTTLRKISDSDLHLLGLSDEYARPEWMILTILPVPPPPVRPSIAVDGGAMRSKDDLTYKLGDIIKASVNVRHCEQEGAPAHVITVRATSSGLFS
ncbi:hypothetical protein EVG20_g8625 [Dentipellis fragilis]|uniref:DNA-directed RNA polymerase n=1 Tax=Dentipellis fragilis TaxID=205917 RepID=A0A4Y9Y8T5_9AGAM|nr:hypothetical protein EVG20_g8625 [Dentipellis fragilis]